PTLDVLHNDVGHPVAVEVVLAGVVHRHDAAVVQRRRGLRLTADALLERGVAGVVHAQHLDSNDPTETPNESSPDFGHAATAENFTQLVAVSEESRLRHRVPFLRLRTERTVPASSSDVDMASRRPTA